MGQYSFQELENSPVLCTKDEFRRNIKSYLHQGQRTQLLSQEGGVAELGFNLNYGILHSLREERRCRPPIIKGDGFQENEVFRDGKVRIELDDQDTTEYQEK